jgi:oligopeptide/dipeptide ABC transporter ATP-binding protein
MSKGSLCNELLVAEGLKTHLVTRQGVAKAVDGVDFAITKGEIVGLVGESGCGKSMTSLSILRLVPKPAGRIVGGKVLLYGEDLLEKSEAEMRGIRGKKIAMVPQDAMVALNPLLKVGYQISEPIAYHGGRRCTLRHKCLDLLKRVKVPFPELTSLNYPFQLSGGMSQRVLIAAGVACFPDLLIADEPTTALDVTIQAQILKLLKEIQSESGSSILLITHNLAIVAQICSRVMVMYAGRIVEQAETKTFFKKPAHPYSNALLKSVPVLGKKVSRLFTIKGQPPSLFNLPEGCRFAPRCTQAFDLCFKAYPPEILLEDGHFVSCWIYKDSLKEGA